MADGFVLGVDLDGVCADYETGLRSFVAAERGCPASALPAARTWELVDAGWFADRDEYLAAHERAVHAGLFRTVPAIPGAAENLRALSREGVRIRIVTHRLMLSGAHAIVASDTVQFLDDAGIPYWDLCFVADKAAVHCDVLIDDAPHNIAALTNVGRRVIIFDQSYNRDVHGTRAVSWSQAADIVRMIRRRGGGA